MTTGNVTKHLLKFTFPLFITSVGQQLYSMIDSVIVGRGVGMSALAAIGATDWCYLLILWTIAGLTQGFAVLISKYFGANDMKKLNKAIAMSIILCAIIGSVLTIIGLIGSKPLLILLNTPSNIIDDATTYIVTMISASLIVAAYNMSGAILQALGDSRTPLIAMLISAVLNICLDCLFVFIFEWGVFGAAIASVIAQFASFIFCFIRIRKIDCIDLNKSTWKLDTDLIKRLLLSGAPVAGQYLIISVSGIILQSAVNTQGSLFIAGFTAATRLCSLIKCGGKSLGTACATFFAQNYGASKFNRVKQGVRTSIKISFILYLVSLTVSILFGKYLLKLFINVNESGGQKALEFASRSLIILSSCLVIVFMLYILRNAIQAMQISSMTLITGLVEILGRTIMAKVAIDYIGSDALFMADPVAWLFSLVCTLGAYIHYSKKRLK